MGMYVHFSVDSTQNCHLKSLGHQGTTPPQCVKVFFSNCHPQKITFWGGQIENCFVNIG